MTEQRRKPSPRGNRAAGLLKEIKRRENLPDEIERRERSKTAQWVAQSAFFKGREERIRAAIMRGMSPFGMADDKLADSILHEVALLLHSRRADAVREG